SVISGDTTCRSIKHTPSADRSITKLQRALISERVAGARDRRSALARSRPRARRRRARGRFVAGGALDRVRGPLHRGRWERGSREQIALAVLRTGGDRRVELLERLDAFGDHQRTEVAAQDDDRRHQLEQPRALGEPGDQAAIELDDAWV